MLGSLSLKELVLLILIIVILVSIIGSLIIRGIKAALILFISFILFCLAVFWLPDKIHEWAYTDKTIGDTIQDVQSGEEDESMNKAIESGITYTKENYQSWGAAAKSLFQKAEELTN